MSRSRRLRITSKPASTPSAPSNLPPEGSLSRWLPNRTGARRGSRPSRRANMLPMESTAPGEHVAHGVHADREAEGLAPRLEALPALRVLRGQGEAPDAAARRGADLGHPHEAVPE